ncbi:bifunctional diguanylate cyclase/phosphodiesterase [Parapusillimonas granuli]|uniref:EAL domain-containing protein n=1 Tax=Parapusillimonas granuli TaxID=380911 RepID=A0A853G695_9BURK|nr:EAL domain-containing protein [Parapusillimonas granuli]MBB5217121.1 diguanylate cyclase (GGDEF)-like protein/PAS domain S-box-containing protein [Parapusillimonas granuli]NYT50116.1 EAL domain-containing protein [Parapusillimonas granuli]
MKTASKSVFATIIAAVVIVNLFMIGLLMLALDTARERKEAEVRTTVENLALLLDQNVTGAVSQIDFYLREIQIYLERELKTSGALDESSLSRLLDASGNLVTGLAELRIMDSSGILRYGRTAAAQDATPVYDREFFKRHESDPNAGTQASRLLQGRISNAWMHIFSRRYNHPDGSFAGVVAAAVPASYFQGLLSGLDLGPQGLALMRDLDMALIARHPPVSAPAGQAGAVGGSVQLARLMRSGVSASTFHSQATADGVARLDAYRRLAAMPAFVVVGLGESDYLLQWHDDVKKAFVIAGLFLFASVVFLWVQWRLISSREDATRRSQTLLQNAGDGIHIMDAEGRLLEANEAFRKMLGYDADEIIGMHASRWSPAGSVYEAGSIADRLLGTHDVASIETVFLRKDGTSYPVEITSSIVDLDGQQVIFSSARDITERKKAEDSLRITATAFESQVGMLITNADKVILQVNKAFSEITGYSSEEVVGHTPKLLSSGRHGADFYSRMWSGIAQRGAWHGEIWNKRKNGEVYPQQLSIGAVKDDKGRITHYVATLTDITARKLSEEQVRTLEYYDPLTKLPNRRLLMERLEHALRASERHRCKGALLFVDLDNFKSVNDTAGHQQGDRLLAQAAERLLTCVGQRDTVARLGGDEFVVILDGLSEQGIEAATEARAAAMRISTSLSKPYALGSMEYRGSASVGITLFGGQPESIEEPLKRADMAMHQAKASGRNRVQFFDPQMQAQVRAHMELEGALRVAVERSQFSLYYQPQVDDTGHITGAEVLLRWRHPVKGMISPARFIPLAEETGLIVPLGRWVLEAACTQLAAWAADPHLSQLSLSVNVSATQIRQDSFVSDVFRILDDTGADPRRLNLELTESSLVTEVESVIAKMAALKARGVGFSLDDFGTGYSSLAYLKRLPLDQLKIDQGFVRDILIDPNDAAIAKMTILLAGSLGISVVAEGVETEAQRQFLAEHGCHGYQGYLFGAPMPLEEFEHLFSTAFSH